MHRYITTPIYYANARPHLGHFYTTIAADILARFFRLAGEHVKFTTGTDEHGAKIALAAEQAGRSCQAYVDDVALYFRRMVDDAHTCPDDFIRTTEQRHHLAATAFWQRLVERDQIYLGHYQGWYAVRDEAFYDESELQEGSEPGQKVAPTGAPVQWVHEPCYFFRLSQWGPALLEHYKRHPQAVLPGAAMNETVAFIKSGLRDLAVSRTHVRWGIPVPNAPDHTMYVWVDALTNYLTVLGFPAMTGDMQRFWPQVVHLVGKDILRFHAVYWPALLMAADLPVPQRIFSHGWWLSQGQKMSKSLGNVVDPRALVKEFGIDRVRYFLFRHVRFGQDGDYTRAHMIARSNQELADRLGNLVHRVVTFVVNRLQGRLPSLQGRMDQLSEPAKQLFFWGKNFAPQAMAWMDQQDIYSYLDEIYRGLTQANGFMTSLAPWQLLKQYQEDPQAPGAEDVQQAMENGLNVLLHFVRDMAIVLWPVMPLAAQQMMQILGRAWVFEAADKALQPSLGVLGMVEKWEGLMAPMPLFAKLEGA